MITCEINCCHVIYLRIKKFSNHTETYTARLKHFTNQSVKRMHVFEENGNVHTNFLVSREFYHK